MFCIGPAVDSFRRCVEQHASSIAVTQQLDSAPIAVVVTVSGKYHDGIGLLGSIDDEIAAGVEDCEERKHHEDSSYEEFSEDRFWHDVMIWRTYAGVFPTS